MEKLKSKSTSKGRWIIHHSPRPLCEAWSAHTRCIHAVCVPLDYCSVGDLCQLSLLTPVSPSPPFNHSPSSWIHSSLFYPHSKKLTEGEKESGRTEVENWCVDVLLCHWHSPCYCWGNFDPDLEQKCTFLLLIKHTLKCAFDSAAAGEQEGDGM